MEIDKIFIINLKERTDRKKQILEELEKQNITNFEIFDAVKPTQNQINLWNPNYCKSKKQKYRIGALGCLLSHLNIMKISIERDYQNILILEDDTEFKFDNSLELLNQYTNNFNYDMIYLSGSHYRNHYKFITKNLIKVTNTHTTSSYLIKRNVMEYIVQNIQQYNREIDVYYSTIIQKNFNCYCVIPHLTTQREDYSDIQGKVVNYILPDDRFIELQKNKFN